MSPEEVLGALGLSPPSRTDTNFLRRLYAAFVERVPFESVSKIVRNREIAGREAKPRRPDVFWEDFVERGAGGTCFARTAAFAELADGLGLPSRPLLGAISRPESHAALLFETPGGPLLADVGYPLPEPLGIEPGQRETAIGAIAVSRREEDIRIDFVSGPERGRSIAFDLRPAEPARWARAWEETFDPEALFLRTVVLRRVQGHRVLRFAEGEVQILDAHSRARIPLPGPDRAGRLAIAFDMDADLVGRALSIAGDPEPAAGSTRVEAYGDSPDAAEIFERLSTAEGYRRWASGVGEATITDATADGFRVRIRGGDGEELDERVSVAAGLLTIERRTGLERTGLTLDRPANAPPRLVRFAELPGAREEFLRVDAGRGRIAGLLAMDLLAAERAFRDPVES